MDRQTPVRQSPLAIAFLLACLVARADSAGAKPKIAPFPEFTGKCVAVTDGDTLKILRGKEEVRVRLHGIDTPEKKQPYGSTAKEFTSRLAFGRTLRVVERGKDRNKRLIGVVYSGKTMLNGALVDAGLAWAFRKYSLDFVSNENRARSARKGLWKDLKPVPPWEWRASRRKRPPAVPSASKVERGAS